MSPIVCSRAEETDMRRCIIAHTERVPGRTVIHDRLMIDGYLDGKEQEQWR